MCPVFRQQVIGVFAFRCPPIISCLNDLSCKGTSKPLGGQADILTPLRVCPLCVSVPRKPGFQCTLQPAKARAADESLEPDKAVHLSQRSVLCLAGASLYIFCLNSAVVVTK